MPNTDLQEIRYTTTYSSEEVAQLKSKYLKNKEIFISSLKEIISMIENAGDEPLSGDIRKSVMNKFSMIDHRLLDRFDVSSYEYFESKEAIED